MKANELMVGDWVMVIRPHNRREKVRVKSVIGNGTIEAKTKDGLVVFGELAVEPIPLTAEILKKNGFICKFDGDIERVARTWVLEGFFIDQLYTDGFYWRNQGSLVSIRRLYYVHELQHALRLLGIEKEIML